MSQNTEKFQNDQGFLLFNHQSSVDYNSIAKTCVTRLKKFFPNTPIAVCGDPIDIADHHIPTQPIKNNRVFNGGIKDWFNLGRSQAYDLTPFDNTIILDTDYVVNSCQLQLLFDSHYPLLMHKKFFMLNKNQYQTWPLGQSGIDMYFATVLKFSKNAETQKFFKIWNEVLENYSYYANIYGFSSTLKRNDYAVTIALMQMNNFAHNSHCEIPWPKIIADLTVDIVNLNDHGAVLKDQHSTINLQQDVHVLKKESFANVA